jgi:putative nucleotidyltransferase with HDIG domain
MKAKLASYLSGVSKELWLIFSIVASAGIFNYFIGGQRLILTFYNIPTCFAAYYFGRRRAVEAALASILFVTWVDMMNPTILGRQSMEMNGWLTWSDLTIWAGFLLVFAYATGSLYEQAERRLTELKQTYSGLLQILSQIISNDKFTQNHSYRVSVYATQIAGEMGFNEERIEDIRAAALLHDIGKLETSRDLLYKAAKLTQDEVKEMKTHVQKGVDLLNPVAGSLRRILPIILAHHDKFDGSGYHSTKGEDIPIEARILSVADVYDSLVSDRPYRKGLSPFEARDMIVNREGSDFDPRVIKAFEAAFQKQRLEVPEVMV